MLALTQCWFTRTHVPSRSKHKDADGAWFSHCRHCERRIVSWGKNRWYMADGFNVTRLSETTGTRFFYLIDIADDFVLARFPVGHLKDNAAIEDFRRDLEEEYLVGPAAIGVELRDSNHDG